MESKKLQYITRDTQPYICYELGKPYPRGTRTELDLCKLLLKSGHKVLVILTLDKGIDKELEEACGCEKVFAIDLK